MTSVVTSKKVSKASKAKSSAKNGKVTSSLDKENPTLTAQFISCINFEGETKAFWDSVKMIEEKKISYRGVKESLKKAQEKGALPSLVPSMAQYFQQASILLRLPNGKELKVKEAILTIQNGKRSKAYKSAKDFDKALAVAKSATPIVKNSKAGKRTSKSVAPTTEHADKGGAENKPVTFSQGIETLLNIAQNRTDLSIKDMDKAVALLGVLKSAILSQKAKDIKHPVVAEKKSA